MINREHVLSVLRVARAPGLVCKCFEFSGAMVALVEAYRYEA